MKKVLIINASVRKERSYSRRLSMQFVENWQLKHPLDVFTFREAGTEIIPGITESWIASAFSNPANRTEADQQILELSDELVRELKENDIYVIATPMYNWSIPSGLKAYVDQITRINETWKFKSGVPDGQYVGLLKDKKMFVLSSRGDTGYGENEKNSHMNFQTAYLKFVFGILGVNDVNIISLDNEEFGGELFENSQKDILEIINAIE